MKPDTHIQFHWVVWFLISKRFFCIRSINPLTCVLNIFPICVSLFTLFMVFVIQKFLIFILSHVSICFFIVYSICVMLRSFHPKIYKYSPMLSSSTFTVLFFTFKASGIYCGGDDGIFFPQCLASCTNSIQ